MATTRASVATALCVTLVLGSGCAQIISRSTVEINPRTDVAPLVIGPPGGEVTARGMEVEWTQDGDRLALRLAESRTCASVRHVPVVRIERVDRRTAGGAMWFEYGIGAAALATGLAGLISPQSFSQGSTTIDGQIVEDTSAGYRIGGIFTGLGAILLTAAVVDTVRTRNEVIYTDAYRREQGGTTECRDPLVPLRAQTVELLVDEWSTVEPTGDDGTVRFLLPQVDQLPRSAREVIEATARWDEAKAEADAEAARVAEEARAEAEAEAEAARNKRGRRKGKRTKEPSPDAPASGEVAVAESGPTLGPRPEPLVIKGVLRVDKSRALAVDFLVPYDAEGARTHGGQGAVEPIPAVGPPPPQRAKAQAKGSESGEASTTPVRAAADSESTASKEADGDEDGVSADGDHAGVSADGDHARASEGDRGAGPSRSVQAVEPEPSAASPGT